MGSAGSALVKLPMKRELFCQRYVVHGNATLAAEEARYSKRSAKQIGCDLLQEPVIAERVAQLLAEKAARNAIDADWITGRLRENVERAMQAEQVLDSHGKPSGEYRYDGAVANRALELLGKNIGLFTDRVDHTTNGKPLPPTQIAVVLVKPQGG